jgi:hypothetical protein
MEKSAARNTALFLCRAGDGYPRVAAMGGGDGWRPSGRAADSAPDGGGGNKTKDGTGRKKTMQGDISIRGAPSTGRIMRGSARSDYRRCQPVRATRPPPRVSSLDVKSFDMQGFGMQGFDMQPHRGVAPT